MAATLDRYSLHARALPVYLTIAPTVLFLAAILPQGLNLQVSGTTAILFMPLAFMAGQLGADYGKRLERRLWEGWGGPPTIRFLRHSNNEFNEVTRDRVHEKLRALGLYVPSAEEEAHDQQTADAHFESCAEELIRRTRDSARYPLVFKELTAYGFRRNMLGLKPIALPINIIALLGCVASAWIGWNAEEPHAVAIGTTLLTFGLMLIWLVWVNEEMVSLAAKRYARFLLEAVLELE